MKVRVVQILADYKFYKIYKTMRVICIYNREVKTGWMGDNSVMIFIFKMIDYNLLPNYFRSKLLSKTNIHERHVRNANSINFHQNNYNASSMRSLFLSSFCLLILIFHRNWKIYINYYAKNNFRKLTKY